MTPKLQRLFDALVKLGFSPKEDRGELTVVVNAPEYGDACTRLRDDPSVKFEQLVDLCGVDYAAYADKPRVGPRFAAVVHLLSVQHNWRLRVRAFCADDEFPVLAAVSRYFAECDGDEQFEFGMDLMIRGLTAKVAEGSLGDASAAE